MIVAAPHGIDPEYGVPVFRGRPARRALFALFGLPNTAPTADERERLGPLAWVATRRLLFVDDWDDGRPCAVWMAGRRLARSR